MMQWRQLSMLLLLLGTVNSCATENPNNDPKTDTSHVSDSADNDLTPEPEVAVEDAVIPQEDAPTPPATVDGHLGDGTAAELFPPPPEPSPRSLKRMNLNQLQAAILTSTGMTSWVTNKKNTIEKNALSLGRPDYESSVSESLSPGLLFDKLLGDSAREICPLLMEKEKAAQPEERIFIKHAGLEDTLVTAPELIRKNLRMLLLRFHGNYLPKGSPQLEPWLTLFETAVNDTETPNPVDGWSVVCTTLIVHPDFISY